MQPVPFVISLCLTSLVAYLFLTDISYALVWLFMKISETPRVLLTWYNALKRLVFRSSRLRDGCQICLGARGGVPGNENHVAGRVMCDYCHGL